MYICVWDVQGFQKTVLNLLHGAVVKSGCEPTDKGAWNQMWVFWKNNLCS